MRSQTDVGVFFWGNAMDGLFGAEQKLVPPPPSMEEAVRIPRWILKILTLMESYLSKKMGVTEGTEEWGVLIAFLSLLDEGVLRECWRLLYSNPMLLWKNGLEGVFGITLEGMRNLVGRSVRDREKSPRGTALLEEGGGRDIRYSGRERKAIHRFLYKCWQDSKKSGTEDPQATVQRLREGFEKDPDFFAKHPKLRGPMPKDIKRGFRRIHRKGNTESKQDQQTYIDMVEEREERERLQRFEKFQREGLSPLLERLSATNRVDQQAPSFDGEGSPTLLDEQEHATSTANADESTTVKSEGDIKDRTIEGANRVVKKLMRAAHFARRPKTWELLEKADKCRFKNKKINFTKLGRELGKSDNTARAWCRDYRIE